MHKEERTLLAWLAREHGHESVIKALTVGWFRDALAIATQLGEGDARYFAANALTTALGRV